MALAQDLFHPEAPMATGSLATTTTTEKRQRKRSRGVPVYVPLLFLLPAILI